jgi:hypothetical protein
MVAVATAVGVDARSAGAGRGGAGFQLSCDASGWRSWGGHDGVHKSLQS